MLPLIQQNDKDMTTQEIANEIRRCLELGFSKYFNVENSKGETVTIRVSNHSANNKNNSDNKTLSFIKERTEQKKSAYNSMICEWAMLENGLTDTYEELEDILENELD